MHRLGSSVIEDLLFRKLDNQEPNQYEERSNELDFEGKGRKMYMNLKQIVDSWTPKNTNEENCFEVMSSETVENK